MVKYETTVVDLEAGTGGIYQTTVAAVPEKSSRSWIWKTVSVIAFISLCAAAALFFSLHMMKSDQKDLRSFAGQQTSTQSGVNLETVKTDSPEHGKILKQIAERTKAAIHLHGDVVDGSLKWRSGVDQSFEQGGLKLIDNQIHIPADGLYFVYSQVSYTIKCESSGDDQKFLSHTILRYSDSMGKSMPLQNSVQSVTCHSQDEGKMKYSTVYIGAVFKLNEDDKLSTNTEHESAVDEESSKTFFGVFAL